MKSVIPIQVLGPGTHTEDTTLDYLPMPTDMHTYSAPLPTGTENAEDSAQAHALLQQVVDALQQSTHEPLLCQRLSAMGLSDGARGLINAILGEGEASAVLESADGRVQERYQEAVFAGVWRCLRLVDGVLDDDAIEVGPLPHRIREVAAEDAGTAPEPWAGDLPEGVLNAPPIVEEVFDHSAQWRAGDAPHVVNLSLLPMSAEDIAFLDHQIGTGRVLMLSRGYGNCRMTNTRLPNCWRIVHYNSVDKVILNCVEVVDMPEIALAAPEDLCDSYERLDDVLRCLQES